MDYDALEKEARLDAKAFRENAVYDSEGDPVRLTVTADRIDRYADAIATLRAEIVSLRQFIDEPPQHDFWGAGEPDCPKDIKAGNGELHTLRCKVCGVDNPGDQICRAALAANREG